MKIDISDTVLEHKVGVASIGYKSEREIPRMFDPFIGHVDTMIYGGGKFDFYEGEDYYDDVDFAENRYKDKVEFIGYEFSGSQVDKRQRYLDLAGKAKCDFLICIDTDDYIMPKYSDWNKFYFQLFMLSEIVPDRVFYKWVWIPSKKLWPKQGNEMPSNRWLKSPRIHKKPGTMRYCMNRHYVWCSKRTTDEKMIKWQLKHRGEENPYQFAPKNVIDGVRDTMDRTLRTPEQVKKGSYWAKMNQHAENSREYYTIAPIIGTPAPDGYTWDEWEKKPHTYDIKTGRRIEL
jgi:hypothetical protein